MSKNREFNALIASLLSASRRTNPELTEKEVLIKLNEALEATPDGKPIVFMLGKNSVTLFDNPNGGLILSVEPEKTIVH